MVTNRRHLSFIMQDFRFICQEQQREMLFPIDSSVLRNFVVFFYGELQSFRTVAKVRWQRESFIGWKTIRRQEKKLRKQINRLIAISNSLEINI